MTSIINKIFSAIYRVYTSKREERIARDKYKREKVAENFRQAYINRQKLYERNYPSRAQRPSLETIITKPPKARSVRE